MKIPILNIYYLLCYAWDKLEEKEIVDVNAENFKEILDLFAKILINGTTHLIKIGLDRDYIVYQEDISRIRGKVNFSESIKRNILHCAKLNCEYDELDYNILHNQILKSTIRELIKIKKIDKDLKSDLIKINRYFNSIDVVKISNKLFSQVRLNRNNYFYDFLLKVCYLVYNNLLIDEKTGDKKFKDFIREESKMSVLFESFVRNFYKKELEGYESFRETIKWDGQSYNDESKERLPVMQTDISLVSINRKIIIDTKYYKEALRKNYNKEKIISNNLYQIFSYLKNVEVKDKISKKCEGILLYPVVKKEINLRYKISNHKLFIKTINLSQDWKNIHKDLIKIIEN